MIKFKRQGGDTMTTTHVTYPCAGALSEAIVRGSAAEAEKALRACLLGDVPAGAVERSLLAALAAATNLDAAAGKAADDRLRDLLRQWSDRMVARSAAGEAIEAQIVLATLPGDGHDAGRYLWRLLLRRRGCGSHDLGVRAPAPLANRAVSLKADALALHVFDAGVRPGVQSLVANLAHRGAEIPILIGGPGVDEAFAQWVAIPQGGSPYWGGVYYCDDGLEMVQVLKQIVLFTPPPPAHTHEAPLADACGPAGCSNCASCGLAGACELEEEAEGNRP
jgi:methylmalonyl-CoA mutase cobalamin-binding subunit